MAGDTEQATGDIEAGATPTPSSGVRWPTVEDLASWNETPSETDEQDTTTEDPTDEGTEPEADAEEPQPETKRRPPVPHDRFETQTRQKQEALQRLAQAEAKNELLQMQLQQVLDHVQRMGSSAQPNSPAEEEFVDPDRAELDALKKELADVKSWRQEQVVAATAQSFEQEYNQALSLYPLAGKATPLVFALLENNAQLSVSDAVKEVHNHLSGVLPAQPAASKPVVRPVKNPAARPPPPKGATSNASALAALPRYKTLEEAQKAFLRTE